jgi:Family of unknown function (DUF6252)
MKTLKSILSIFIITLLLLSCSKSDDKPTPAINDSFLKAKIDGVEYNANANQVIAGKTANRITIISTTVNGNFSFSIYNPAGASTYLTSDKGPVLYASFIDNNFREPTFYAGLCGNVGTLTIASISDTELSGTFSFVGKKSGDCLSTGKNITEGAFKIKFAQ